MGNMDNPWADIELEKFEALIKQVVANEIPKNTDWDPKKAEDWVQNIVDNILKTKAAQNNDNKLRFKYFCTCMVMQRTGQPLRLQVKGMKDRECDGGVTTKAFELDSLIVYVTL